MFDTLQDRLAATFKNLRGKGRLSEADIDATAAYAQGEQAAAWLGSRPIDSALVVATDGRITTVVPPR